MADTKKQEDIKDVSPEPLGSGLSGKTATDSPKVAAEETDAEAAPPYTDSTDETSNTNSMSAQPYEPDLGDFDFHDDEDGDAGEAGAFDDLEGFRIDEDRFTALKPIWNDTKFAIFFIVVAVLFIFKAAYLVMSYLPDYINDNPVSAPIPNSVFFQFKTIFLFIFITLISIGSSIFIFIKAGRNSAAFTSFGIKFFTWFLVVVSVLAFIIGQILQGLGFGAFAVGLYFINKRYQPAITLAGKIMEIVINVLKKYPSTAIAALIGLSSNIIFSVILSIAIGCEYLSYGFNSAGKPIYNPETGETTSVITWGLIFSILFLSFAGLYIIDVLKNAMHVTIGGIYGTWYYLESTFEGMPASEGKSSFKRAMTYSLGSVCFGSLFVVFFQLIAILISIGDEHLGLFGDLTDVLLKFMSMGVGYFNLYAYAFVALYGVSLLKSVRATYKFFKQRGIQAAINDFLIGSSLGFYCLLAAIMSMFATGVYLFLISMIFNIDDSLMAPLTAFAFLMTINVTAALIQTIISGSTVFFFALNKDPAVFQESNPFEFQEISRCYPKVLDKLDI